MADDGFVTIRDFREGDPLSKDHLNETKDSWKSVDSEVGELNIREEGLDRRMFDTDNTWNDFFGSTSRCQQGATIDSGWMPSENGQWSPINFRKSATSTTEADTVTGGIHDHYARIQFDWNPQIHTYVIFRASFRFRWDVGLMGGSGFSAELGSDDPDNFVSNRDKVFVQFGIQVSRPGGSLSDDMHIHSFDLTNGRIFAPTQLGLSYNYSSDCTGTFSMIDRKFDRRTAMTSSITMVAAGQSWQNPDEPLDNSNHAIDFRRAGVVEAQLVWRQFGWKNDRECTIDGSDAKGRVFPEYGNMQFFAQTFMR
mgnify:FL=1|tara:strand:+ start:24088 stop:25017 length:930 start_codon:yes stop_codon:yes gene_type:complete